MRKQLFYWNSALATERRKVSPTILYCGISGSKLQSYPYETVVTTHLCPLTWEVYRAQIKESFFGMNPQMG